MVPPNEAGQESPFTTPAPKKARRTWMVGMDLELKKNSHTKQDVFSKKVPQIQICSWDPKTGPRSKLQ